MGVIRDKVARGSHVEFAVLSVFSGIAHLSINYLTRLGESINFKRYLHGVTHWALQSGWPVDIPFDGLRPPMITQVTKRVLVAFGRLKAKAMPAEKPSFHHDG